MVNRLLHGTARSRQPRRRKSAQDRIRRHALRRRSAHTPLRWHHQLVAHKQKSRGHVSRWNSEPKAHLSRQLGTTKGKSLVRRQLTSAVDLSLKTIKHANHTDTGTAAYSNPVDRTLEAGRRSRRRGRETARLPKPVRPHHTQHGETSWVQRPALRGPRLPVGPCTTTAATTRRHPQSRTRPPDREAAHAGGRAPARRRSREGKRATEEGETLGNWSDERATLPDRRAAPPNNARQRTPSVRRKIKTGTQHGRCL